MSTYLPGVTDIYPEPSLFVPNFNFMDQMLRRRQGMYEQGFAQVSGAYSFINRPVTHSDSANIRDNFLKQAKTSLKNLSAMDLSQQQNVVAAKSVFEPFVSNQDVLGDMALTSHWDKQEQVAEGFRLKDGGKEYSDDNINYVRMQRQAFSQSKLSDWSSYYSNRRYYTPYYDWNKEISEKFKDFKPSSMKIERRAGLYNITESNKGATEEDVKKYLLATISDKAKNQMRIEAAVRFSNPEFLAGQYKDGLKKDISALTDDVRSIENKIKLSGNLQEKIQLADSKKQLLDTISDINREIGKIESGDIAYIRQNSEKIAFGLYFNDVINKMAKGLSYNEYERTIDGDDVAMMMYREGQEWARLRFRESNENARHAQTLAAKKVEEGVGLKEQISLPADMSNVLPPESIGVINSKLSELNKRNAALSDVLKNHVSMVLNKPANQLTDKDIMDYGKSEEGKADPRYINYKRAIADLQVDRDMLQSNLVSAQDYARQKLGQDYVALEKEAATFIKKPSARGVSAKEMFDAVMNGTASMTQQKDEAGKPIQGSYKLTVNDKTFTVSKSLFGDDPIVNLYEEAIDITKGRGAKTYNKALDEYFGQAKAKIPMGFIAPDNDKGVSTTKNKISTVVGRKPDKITGVVYGGNRDVFFSIDDDKLDTKSVETALQVLGLEAKYLPTSNRFYVKEIPGVSRVSFGLDMYNQYSETEKKLISYGQGYAGHNYSSPYFYPADITKDRKGNPLPQFNYKIQKSGEDKIYYLYNELNPTKPINSYSNLTDLMDDARQFMLHPENLVPFLK